jgi:hypothetical protein
MSTRGVADVCCECIGVDAGWVYSPSKGVPWTDLASLVDPLCRKRQRGFERG